MEKPALKVEDISIRFNLSKEFKRITYKENKRWDNSF